MNKPQLKPLNYKKPNTITPPAALLKPALNSPAIDTGKSVLNKKPSNGETIKPVKYERSSQRSSKTVEHYQCDDYELELQDNHYFQTQLEKNIKTEILNKTGKPQSKAQIVLPKLESDVKTRNMKDLEKEMDLEMSRLMDYECGQGYD